MTFPKGPVWQQLRVAALQTFPEDVALVSRTPVSLSRWRQAGAYQVVGCDTKGFTLECSKHELSIAIFSEASLLLDHVAEQRAQTLAALFKSSWHSPAWSVVTIYYWSFFAALAFSRLTGTVFHYLKKDDVDAMKAAIGTKCSLGSGAYDMEIAEESATVSTVHLRKYGSANYHESVWRFVHGQFESLCKLADDESNLLEARLFRCLAEKAGTEGAIWPTSLRNIVNYRPGAAYTEVRHEPVIELARFLRKNSIRNLEEAISLLETLRINLHGKVVDGSCLDEYSSALLLKTVLLTSLCEELMEEVVKRRRVDRRWSNARRDFAQAHDAFRTEQHVLL